jgi:hypothetical protein
MALIRREHHPVCFSVSPDTGPGLLRTAASRQKDFPLRIVATIRAIQVDALDAQQTPHQRWAQVA